ALIWRVMRKNPYTATRPRAGRLLRWVAHRPRSIGLGSACSGPPPSPSLRRCRSQGAAASIHLQTLTPPTPRLPSRGLLLAALVVFIAVGAFDLFVNADRCD